MCLNASMLSTLAPRLHDNNRRKTTSKTFAFRRQLVENDLCTHGNARKVYVRPQVGVAAVCSVATHLCTPRGRRCKQWSTFMLSVFLIRVHSVSASISRNISPLNGDHVGVKAHVKNKIILASSTVVYTEISSRVLCKDFILETTRLSLAANAQKSKKKKVLFSRTNVVWAGPRGCVHIWGGVHKRWKRKVELQFGLCSCRWVLKETWPVQ